MRRYRAEIGSIRERKRDALTDGEYFEFIRAEMRDFGYAVSCVS